eukprot:TRINITY_DN482_c0_g1_i1.p1 TRINITY_DN482_c0_g1~~TRINITY_DN482_c0_g1_i1.p1  ORF type:complete len:376 (+),score=106.57 TRINITY_DN482_c0_g1_i1:128-1255(+)
MFRAWKTVPGYRTKPACNMVPLGRLGIETVLLFFSVRTCQSFTQIAAMSARSQSQQPFLLQAQQIVPSQYLYMGMPMQMQQQVPTAQQGQVPQPVQMRMPMQIQQQVQTAQQDYVPQPVQMRMPMQIQQQVQTAEQGQVPQPVQMRMPMQIQQQVQTAQQDHVPQPVQMRMPMQIQQQVQTAEQGQVPQPIHMPQPFQTPDKLQAFQQVQITPRELALEKQFLTLQSKFERTLDEANKAKQQLKAERLEKNRAEKRAEEAEENVVKANRMQKESADTTKQLQIQKQQVESDAIRAVRLAKSQISKAHEEVNDLQEQLRQARADLILANAAKTAAEELVARNEAEQAAQARSLIDRTMLAAQQKAEEAQRLTDTLR